LQKSIAWVVCYVVMWSAVQDSIIRYLKIWYAWSNKLDLRVAPQGVTKTVQNQTYNGEFDPGSGRTLAACLTHASQGERFLREIIKLANG
jgi:cytochrome c biogenesis protein ResB